MKCSIVLMLLLLASYLHEHATPTNWGCGCSWSMHRFRGFTVMVESALIWLTIPQQHTLCNWRPWPGLLRADACRFGDLDRPATIEANYVSLRDIHCSRFLCRAFFSHHAYGGILARLNTQPHAAVHRYRCVQLLIQFYTTCQALWHVKCIRIIWKVANYL